MNSLRAIAALAVLGFAGPASAQPVTVQSLIDQQYALVSTMLTKDGAGLFFQKNDKMFFCVVAESKGSEAVTTRYCKPVR